VALDKIYAFELDRLQSLGREFAKENPAMAPYLSGAGGDADVERLLQGFAFLSAMVRQKMDDQIPEFIGDVADLVGPELVKPMPAVVVLALSMAGKNQDGYKVAAGTTFGSKPVDGTSCEFSTSWPLTIQPVQVKAATTRSLEAGRSRLSLEFETLGITAAQWTGKNISFYLASPLAEACSWVGLMRKRLAGVCVRDASAKIPPHELALSFTGLDFESRLFQSGHTIAPHLRLLREFLAFSERAFFVDIVGFDTWSKPVGNNFIVDIDLDIELDKLPKTLASYFVVNAVPAANVFEAYANPIELTHLRESYPLTPSGFEPKHAQVFDVISVTGRVQGESKERQYVPTTALLIDQANLRYQVVAQEGTQAGQIQYKLRLPFSDLHELSGRETLSIKMMCTNSQLPERIRLGDVSVRTANSPEKVSVTNITAPLGSSRPALGNDSMWKIVAHARLNLQALVDADTLKELLQIYLPEGGDPARLAASRRRVQGIEDVSLSVETKMIRGSLLRGQRVSVRLNVEFYASFGELIMFGEMLAQFFAAIVGLNSYVSVGVTDTSGGEIYEWRNLVAPGLTL
jgi:type VI secretion system protein ImpG